MHKGMQWLGKSKKGVEGEGDRPEMTDDKERRNERVAPWAKEALLWGVHVMLGEGVEKWATNNGLRHMPVRELHTLHMQILPKQQSKIMIPQFA